MGNRRRETGFTLIEIMIVVAIVAIIASIAFSAFSDSSQDAKRMRGLSDLTSLNDAVGRAYQTNYTYAGIDDAQLAALAGAAGITLSPDYTYAIVVAADGQSYTITATPTASSGLTGNLEADNVQGVHR